MNWLIPLVAIVVAVCAGLAAMGFRGRVSTVGIDLGTTFSVVGLSQHGKVVIVEDKLGHKIFPSIVSYLDNGEIVVGYEALRQLSSNPHNTIFNAKRFIGRSLQDDDVKLYAAEHAFNVVENDSISNHSRVGFAIETSVPIKGAHYQLQDQAEGSRGVLNRVVVSPEQIGTEVLKYLLQLTSDYLGHKQVNKAVIAVPAKFSALQRQATAAAYKAAGLKVMRVMEEPTAAAVAYRLHKRTDIHHILVYDFGGGTLDVSLLYVAKGSVEVYATDGDDTLGGSDMDLCLFKILKEKLIGEYGIDLNTHADDESAQTGSASPDGSVATGISSSSSSSSSSCTATAQDLCTAAAVHAQAEDIKKQLTHQDEVEFKCFSNKTGQQVSFPVYRETDFEQGCRGLFDRGMLPVTRLLESLEMDKSDIDEVVLVGGSTRIPKVKQQLRDYFNKEKLNDHIDPDITVAYGAASVLD